MPSGGRQETRHRLSQGAVSQLAARIITDTFLALNLSRSLPLAADVTMFANGCSAVNAYADAHVNAAVEPGAWILVGGALIGLAFYRRRK